MEKTNLGKIYRFHSKGPGARVTVVGMYYPETDEFKFATSRCSTKDNFSKKIGRDLAESRMMKGQFNAFIKGNITGKGFVEQSLNLCTLISRNPNNLKRLFMITPFIS